MKMKSIILILVFIAVILITLPTYGETTTTGIVGNDADLSKYKIAIGKTIHIYQSEMLAAKYLFCADKDTVLGNSNSYKLNQTVDTNSYRTVNGFPLSEIPSELDKTKFKEVTKDDKHTIAYILSEKPGVTYTKKQIQIALWKTSINVGSALTSKTGTYSTGDIKKGNELYKKAQAYSVYKNEYTREPSFEETEVESNNAAGIIGPFKINYIYGKKNGYTFGKPKAAYVVIDGEIYPIAMTKIPENLYDDKEDLLKDEDDDDLGVDDDGYAETFDPVDETEEDGEAGAVKFLANLAGATEQPKVTFTDENGVQLTKNTGLDPDTIVSSKDATANKPECTGFPASGTEFYIRLDSSLRGSEVESINFLFNEIDAKVYYGFITGKKTLTVNVPAGTNSKGESHGALKKGYTNAAQKILFFGGIRNSDIIKKTFKLKESAKIEIKGTVWEDAGVGKANQANGYMNIKSGEDKGIEGIPVYLVDTATNKRVKETKTNSSGEYKFAVNPGKYRVEFEYDGLGYASTKKMNGANTTKAEETLEERVKFNDQFNSITKGKATGINASAGKTLNLTYTIDKSNGVKALLNRKDSKGIPLYKMMVSTETIDLSNANPEAGEVVEDVNLGLVARFEADFKLTQDLVKAEVTYNGQTITKEYGGLLSQALNQITLTEEFIRGNKPSAYDVDLTGEELSKGELYLTYAIIVTNQSDRAIGKVNDIVQYADKGYDLKEAWYGGRGDPSQGTKLTTSKTTGSSYNTYTISGLDKLGDLDKVVGSTSKNYFIVYMKFAITNLSSAFANTNEVNKIVTAEITGYSFNNEANYRDSANTDLPSKFEKAKYINAQVDCNSAPGNGVYNDVANFENDTDNAPTTKLKIDKENNVGSGDKTIKGKVWEDTNKNGKIDSGEPIVIGATVKLINQATGAIMTTKSNDKGEYEFLNVSDRRKEKRFKWKI